MARPSVLRALPHLLSPRLSRASLIERQERAFARLISNVGDVVPELRARLRRAGLAASDGRARPRQIPPVSRADLQAVDLAARMAPGVAPERLVRRQTGGSSGRPLLVYRTRLEEHFINLYRRRSYRLMGLRMRDRCATLIWPGNAERRLLALPLRDRLGIFRDQLLTSSDDLEELGRQLEEIQPTVLVSYPSILEKLVSVVAPSIRPRLVFAGGETLLPEVQEKVAAAFGARVLRVYGLTECNEVAFECPTTGHLHVNDDSVLVEVLNSHGDPAAEGEQGEVVVTSLHSYVMPFVRYRTGDIAVVGPASCPCGLPYSTLTDLRGRVSDYIIGADGTWIHPVSLVGALLGVVGERVRQFQFVQESRELIRLTVSTSRPLGERAPRARLAIEEVLGAGVRVEVVDVGEGRIERVGRHRICVSRINSIYDEYDPIRGTRDD